MSLHPCPQCRRHIRHTETQCPFCGASVEGAFNVSPRLPRPSARLSRSALAAMGAALASAPLAACGDEDDMSSTVPIYGIAIAGMSPVGVDTPVYGTAPPVNTATGGTGGASGGTGGESATAGNANAGAGGSGGAPGMVDVAGAGGEPAPVPIYGIPIGPIGDRSPDASPNAPAPAPVESGSDSE